LTGREFTEHRRGAALRSVRSRCRPRREIETATLHPDHATAFIPHWLRLTGRYPCLAYARQIVNARVRRQSDLIPLANVLICGASRAFILEVERFRERFHRSR
jgi:hypothetical protein